MNNTKINPAQMLGKRSWAKFSKGKSKKEVSEAMRIKATKGWEVRRKKAKLANASETVL